MPHAAARCAALYVSDTNAMLNCHCLNLDVYRQMGEMDVAGVWVLVMPDTSHITCQIR